MYCRERAKFCGCLLISWISTWGVSDLSSICSRTNILTACYVLNHFSQIKIFQVEPTGLRSCRILKAYWRFFFSWKGHFPPTAIIRGCLRFIRCPECHSLCLPPEPLKENIVVSGANLYVEKLGVSWKQDQLFHFIFCRISIFVQFYSRTWYVAHLIVYSVDSHIMIHYFIPLDMHLFIHSFIQSIKNIYWLLTVWEIMWL